MVKPTVYEMRSALGATNGDPVAAAKLLKETFAEAKSGPASKREAKDSGATGGAVEKRTVRRPTASERQRIELAKRLLVGEARGEIDPALVREQIGMGLDAARRQRANQALTRMARIVFRSISDESMDPDLRAQMADVTIREHQRQEARDADLDDLIGDMGVGRSGIEALADDLDDAAID